MAGDDINVGWVQQPNTRGTFDIIQSCLLTIFVCCWTIVHPKLARPGSSKLHRFLDKTVCLWIAAIAPEVLVYISVCEYLAVKDSARTLSSEPTIGDKWTIVHSFLAQMGGFGLASTMDDPSISRNAWIDERAILHLIKDGRLDPSQLPTRSEIEDKGKADSLIKTVALAQALWLLAQCIGRAVQHLPITTIEIASLAYIPCALIISFCWWNKPMDVNDPIYLHLMPLALARIVRRGTDNEDGTHSRPVKVYAYHDYPLAHETVLAALSVLGYVNRWGLITATFCLFFGGLHCLAWNFHFPTSTERLLWRVCSLVIAGSIPISWLFTHATVLVLKRLFPVVWYDMVHSRDYAVPNEYGPGEVVKGRLMEFATAFHGIGLVLYVLARLYLIVEMFSGLRSQPRDVYQTLEWTNFWPHG